MSKKRIKYRCPKCFNSNDNLSIQVTGWCRCFVDDKKEGFSLDGPDYTMPQDEYDNDKSPMLCRDCGHEGPARTFIAKGWDLFETDTRGWEIQKDDEADVFDSDEDAIDYIASIPQETFYLINQLRQELFKLGRQAPFYRPGELADICRNPERAKAAFKDLLKRINRGVES